jgi:hypothetical protein
MRPVVHTSAGVGNSTCADRKERSICRMRATAVRGVGGEGKEKEDCKSMDTVRVRVCVRVNRVRTIVRVGVGWG